MQCLGAMKGYVTRKMRFSLMWWRVSIAMDKSLGLWISILVKENVVNILKVVFVPDYNVSVAEVLIPGSELSQHICNLFRTKVLKTKTCLCFQPSGGELRREVLNILKHSWMRSEMSGRTLLGMHVMLLLFSVTKTMFVWIYFWMFDFVIFSHQNNVCLDLLLDV